MKRDKREIYQVLANELDWIICSFCKFSKSEFNCGELDCHHPLSEKSFGFDDAFDSAQNLGDCWGFRPSMSIALVADIVGIVLANEWQVAGWSTNKDGVLEIVGSKEWLI